MKRLVFAALAATLVSCGPVAKSGPRAYLVEKDNHFAIAVENGKKIEYYPLPAKPYVVIDGTWHPVAATGQAAAGFTPRCPCNVLECERFCMPAPKGDPWFKPPEGVLIDPGTEPGGPRPEDPRPPNP